ncbi:MAG TPA: hypothetical protein VJT31_34045 [Rugosimonospora sp.]|nr:hypothetical protein [Rugosimonospora sp.]
MAEDRKLPPEPTAGPLGSLSPSYRLHRRQRRIIEQVRQARSGDHKVPTWALALILVLLLGGWLTFILLS